MAERDHTRSEIMSTLSTVGQRLSTSKARVKLDFSAVQRIYPGGMLMLLAHLELLSEIFPGRIRAACPRGSMAAQLIQHFNFAQRLGVPAAGNQPRHGSVTNWRFATGRQAEGEKILRHIETFAALVGSSVPDGLYNALTEAMTNVRHHAYPAGDSHQPESMRRWWLFSKCISPTPETKGDLYLAFYDVGVGIQASMRTNLLGMREHVGMHIDNVLLKLGVTTGRAQDVQLLRLAVEQPRTSTGLPFRGKGLPEMKEFAASTSGGRMTIVSGHAQYSFQAHCGEATVSKSERGILGTLIMWNLPLTWKEPTT